MEDTKDPDLHLTLFYSNPKPYASEESSLNIIYYDWLIEVARKIENFKVVFTFTREKEILFFI